MGVRWGRIRTGLVIATALVTVGVLAPPGSAAFAAPVVAVPAEVFPPAVQLGAECPSGYLRGATYFLEDFDRGVTPTPSESGVRDPVKGGFFLRSRVPTYDIPGGYRAGPVTVTPGGPVVVAFGARSAPTTRAGLNVKLNGHEVWYDVPLTPSWTTFRLDVTGLLAGSPQRLSVVLDHSWDIEEGPTLSTLDLDDVTVYGCVPRPPSGVRGDWIGNGRTGLIGVPDDGLLYNFPGTGSGGLLAPRRMGVGWRSADVLASVGDVGGDRRTDLLAVFGGRLVLYPGRGVGALGSGVQVGSGWGGAILASPGDVTGDGRPDLWSVRPDGTLHLYRFVSSTSLRYVKQIGNGWTNARIVGIGDLNGDRRPDALGLLRDGCLRFYPGNAVSGLGSAKVLSCGWGIMDWVGSPGDLTGDGRSDLLARRTSDGTLWLYRGMTGGRVATATRVSSGWATWRLLA